MLYELVSREIERREDFLEFLPKQAVCGEIGVYAGEFTKYILRNSDPLECHLFDLWWVSHGKRYYWSGERTDKVFKKARDVIQSHDENQVCFVHIGDCLKTLAAYQDNYFDWLYLDSSHEYEHTRKELALLKLKVKDTGFICGHDWFPEQSHRHHGVYKAVNEFCENEGYSLVYLDNYTNWCIQKFF